MLKISAPRGREKFKLRTLKNSVFEVFYKGVGFLLLIYIFLKKWKSITFARELSFFPTGSPDPRFCSFDKKKTCRNKSQDLAIELKAAGKEWPRHLKGWKNLGSRG